MPAIRYQFVGGASRPTFDTSGMQRSRVQIDCYGATYDDANDLRSAVIAAMIQAAGTLSDGTELSASMPMNPGLDFYEQDSRQYVCMCEFYLLYTLN